MFLLVAFAFIAGIVTILSPCILPVLPFILSGSTGEDKSKPWGVIVGFVSSFTFFTLFLTTIVRFTGVPADYLRYFSIIVLFLFGLGLLIPQFQALLEKAFTAVAGKVPNTSSKTGLFGGLLIGFSLGLLWTPCVGPILASVISLALTGSVNSAAFFITFAYALGTALPMLAIMKGGQSLLQRNKWLLKNTANIQKGFGVLMMVTALAIFNNYDRKFQAYILEVFPKYGVGLTSLENNEIVKKQLDTLHSESDDDMMGKSLDQINRVYPKAPELQSEGAWINSEPLTIEELTNQGKVVLVDFWTFSCINCIRTLPYLRDWHAKYSDKGLVILGVHAPEFEFEKDLDNLQEAVTDFDLKYPIVQDNDFTTWRAYKNRYWPAKYLIDSQGLLRYTHFGEGKYDETEKMIQKLLEEAGASVSDMPVENPQYSNFAQTPETYLGYDRINSFFSNEQITKDEPTQYTLPETILDDRFALNGEWTITSESSDAGPNAELVLNFMSKDVFLVMTPKNGRATSVEVYLDDELVSDLAGDDVVDGQVSVDQERLYHLIELPEPGTHTLKLVFPDGNIKAFAFTFG